MRNKNTVQLAKLNLSKKPACQHQLTNLNSSTSILHEYTLFLFRLNTSIKIRGNYIYKMIEM